MSLTIQYKKSYPAMVANITILAILIPGKSLIKYNWGERKKMDKQQATGTVSRRRQIISYTKQLSYQTFVLNF